MHEAFDVKLKISLKEKAKIAFLEAIKRLIKAAVKVRCAAKHYDDEGLSETNEELCDCCRNIDSNLTLYTNITRELMDYSNFSEDYSYDYDDDEGILDEWDENRVRLYDAGFCLCRWRDELREEEQDEVTRAQLCIVETLISTLGRAVRIFQNNGFGNMPAIEKAYQVTVVQVNNYNDIYVENGGTYIEKQITYNN